MLLCQYVGLICRESDREINSQYLYPIHADDVQSIMPGHLLPSDLVLDAMTFGNIGRYVNDNRYRRLSYDDQEKLVNVETRWVYWKGMIHFVFYAIKQINKGEEVNTTRQGASVQGERQRRGDSFTYARAHLFLSPSLPSLFCLLFSSSLAMATSIGKRRTRR